MTIGDFISAFGLLCLVGMPLWLWHQSWQAKENERIIKETIKKFKEASLNRGENQ